MCISYMGSGKERIDVRDSLTANNEPRPDYCL